MLTVIVGQTFHGTLAEAPVDKTPQRQQANVAPGAEASLALLRERAKKVPFPLMVPTVLERTSWIDRERPVRDVPDRPRRQAQDGPAHLPHGRERVLGRADDRLGGRAGPLRAQRHAHDQGPRATSSTTSGPKLHMVVLRQGGASYWVVNTLLDSLSNETMLAIAKGLKPLRQDQVSRVRR